MAIDTTARPSRRALLTAAIGSAAAAAAASVARVSPVDAADGQSVRIGAENTGASETRIRKTTAGLGSFVGEARSWNSSWGIAGVGTGPANGIWGSAVSGVATSTGATTGHALEIRGGRVRLEQISGVATIQKGKKSATVRPGVDINYRTFVLLTPMANIGSRGLWFTKNGAKDQFTIRMSSPRRAATKIAWLALERG